MSAFNFSLETVQASSIVVTHHIQEVILLLLIIIIFNDLCDLECLLKAIRGHIITKEEISYLAYIYKYV